MTAVNQVLPGMRTLGRGTVLFVNGGSGARPNAQVAGTSIAFAGEGAYAIMLHDVLASENVHVGQLIIPGAITPGHPTNDPAVLADTSGACTPVATPFVSSPKHSTSSPGPLREGLSNEIQQQSRCLLRVPLRAPTSRENGSGTDHGYGNAMLLFGVRGGKVHGTWPGLSSGKLVDGDLAASTTIAAY